MPLKALAINFVKTLSKNERWLWKIVPMLGLKQQTKMLQKLQNKDEYSMPVKADLIELNRLISKTTRKNLRVIRTIKLELNRLLFKTTRKTLRVIRTIKLELNRLLFKTTRKTLRATRTIKLELNRLLFKMISKTLRAAKTLKKEP